MAGKQDDGQAGKQSGEKPVKKEPKRVKAVRVKVMKVKCGTCSRLTPASDINMCDWPGNIRTYQCNDCERGD